jgi:hypothetical protein
MGGKSKSSASTATTVVDGGSTNITASGNATVDFLSDEALKEVLTFASGEGQGSRDLVGDVISGALETFVVQQQRGYQAVTDTAFKAIESEQSEGAQTFKQLLYAGVAIAGIVGATYIFKGKVK